MTTSDLITRLEAVIRDRQADRPAGSYVAELMQDAPESICAKIVEEAYEVVEAARADDAERRSHLIHESADVVFHLLLMLGWAGIPWSEVLAELELRFGVSGNDPNRREQSHGR